MSARSGAIGLAVSVLASCGSRAQPYDVERPPELDVHAVASVACYADEDCESLDLCSPLRCVEQVCVSEPVFCDDADVCTEDGCDAATGLCVFQPLTADQDEDGHPRPLPGFAPGAPGACGDDCNDSSALAFPGGIERCDGVDNDCDGVIDNGALFTPSAGPPILLSGDAAQGTPGGLTFSDSAGAYGAVFTQRLASSQTTFTRISPQQGSVGAAVPVTEVNSDTFAGPIVGRGNVFATAWEDRRDQDYEIYFNRLNTDGEKLGPDVRITNAPGFSLRPTLIEVPSAQRDEYRLAWEDERDGDLGRIYGQRLSFDGGPRGDNVALTDLNLDPSSPTLVAGVERLGLLFNLATPEGRRLAFRSFDFDFGDGSAMQLVDAANPDAASIVANAGQFVVAWHLVQESGAPGAQIFGTVIDERGEQIVSPRGLTEPAEFARYHSIVPLGDRLLLLWSEWSLGRYDIYARELSPALEPIGDRRRLGEQSTEAYAPLAAFGPQGQIGVMFTGRQAASANPHVFFTTLSCEAGADFSFPR